MPVYSFSQIRVFEQCPLKYRYQYIDRIKVAEEPQSPHLLLWNAVHHALEKLYKQLNQFQTPRKETVLGFFHSYRQEKIDYDQIQFNDDTPESVFLARGERYIKEYYDRYAPFGEVKVVMTEGRIVFSLDEWGKLKFRGVIDRLDKEGKTFIINDYKTNKQLPEGDKTMYQEQLTLYALGVQEKYGKYYDKLKARLYYLHFDLIDEWEITNETIKKVSNKYKNTVKEIEDRRFHANMGDATRFPPVENHHCRFCPYMSICPVWAHASMDDEIILGEKTVKGLVDEYAELSKQASDLKKQKEGIKDALSTYLQQKKLKKLFGDAYQLSASSRNNYRVKDSMALEHYLQEQWLLDEYKQLDRFALARGIKNEELDLEEIKDMVEVKESVSLRIKRNDK